VKVEQAGSRGSLPSDDFAWQNNEYGKFELEQRIVFKDQEYKSSSII